MRRYMFLTFLFAVSLTYPGLAQTVNNIADSVASPSSLLPQVLSYQGVLNFLGNWYLIEKTTKDILIQAEDQHYPLRVKFEAADGNIDVRYLLKEIRGHRVRVLVSETQEPAYYSVEWNGGNDAGRMVTSGVYLYRMQAGDFVKSIKLLFIK